MTKIIIMLALLITNLVSAQNLTLTVAASGLKNDKGTVQVGLYDAEGKFLNSIYKGASSSIKAKSATVVFSTIPAGVYAISAYHDENKNGKLDMNFMGIPKEDIACSNNAKGFMGPPKYVDAKFTATKDAIIEIKFNK
jgi:uncharacterized protein (DUF2141 family)